MEEYYLDKALYLAWKYHEGQLDKAGKPYILHPIYVMSCCENIDEKIVACLHDIIEDTVCTPEILLEEGFEAYIVESICLLTRIKEKESYNEYIERLIKSKNKIAMKVKLYDLSHNMSSHRMEVLPKEKSNSLIKRYTKAYNLLMTEMNKLT